MATVQTLKDKSNNTFYPVTKTEAVYNADGSETLDNTLDTKATISTAAGDANKMMKADGTKALVGSDNIDFTTPGFQYQPGTYTINDSYWAGRGRTYTGTTLIRFSMVLPKTIPNGSTVTLTPNDSYGLEVFGPSGVVVSSASTISLITRTDVVPSQNSIYIELYFDTSQVTVPNNVALSVHFAGTITIS